MYQYTGDWDTESVADYIRIEKIALFGDFLCGIEPPILSYDVKRGLYEPVMERELCEQRQQAAKKVQPPVTPEAEPESPGVSGDICLLTLPGLFTNQFTYSASEVLT